MTASLLRVLVVGLVLLTVAACPVAGQLKSGRSPGVATLAFAPDGKALAVGGLDGRLRLLDVPSLREIAVQQADPTALYAVAFSPDGMILASAGSDGVIRFWDAGAGKERRRLKGHSNRIAALAFSPDGLRLASGSYDKTIRVWNVAQGETIHRLDNKDHEVTSLAFSPDGQQLLAGGAGPMVSTDRRQNVLGTTEASPLRLWQVAQGKYREFSGHGHSVALGAGGDVLAGGGLLVDIRRHRRGTSYNGLDRIILLNAAGQKLLHLDWQGYLVAVSPDGKWLATGAGALTHYHHGIMGGNQRTDTRTRVWDLTGCKEILRLPENDATALAFAPGQRYLATGDSGGQVRLWDIDKEKREPTPDPFEIIKKPPAEDKLLTRLDADFEALVKKDKSADKLRQAQKLFHQEREEEALAILRTTRAPAGIPLLLRYWLEHKRPWPLLLFPQTFLALTGKPLEQARPDRAEVEKLVAEWWRPDQVTTDLARFSPAQLQAIVDGLTAPLNDQGHRTSLVSRLHEQLEDALEPEDRQPSLWPEDLHPAMLPLALTAAGYADKAKTETRDAFSVPLASIPLLAMLGEKGQAKELAQIAQQDRHNSAVRLTALLAHQRATGTTLTPALRQILASEKRLERRVLAILAWERAPAADAIETLLPCLDDANRHVRAAALIALRPHKPAPAVPRLQSLLDDRQPDAPLDETLAVLANLRSKASQTVLAEYLQTRLERGGHYSLLWNALFAFEKATGQAWINPRDPTDVYYRDAARRALAWWRKNNPS